MNTNHIIPSQTESTAAPQRQGRKRLMFTTATVAVLLLVAWSTGQDMSSTQPSSTVERANGGNATLVTEGAGSTGTLKMTVNKTTVISTKTPYKRISVGNPEIADVNPIGPASILVTAKKPGSTQLIIWDDADRSQVLDILVNFDLASLNEQLRLMFPGSKIEAIDANGAIALRGHVPSLEVSQQAMTIAGPYGKVANFLDVSGGQQVMLQVRFAEVSRAATSALGVNFGYADGVSAGASNVGQVNPFSNISGQPGNIAAASASPSVTLFGTGQIGSATFAVFISALRQNNLLRVLAEPNLVAISGQEATFLAGGEFPVPIAQNGGGGGTGGTTITVEFKKFGVQLTFVPIVLGEGRIRLKCSPEVSDLDFTNAVVTSGFRIPALTTRTLSTTVELADGQTFALAGLLNSRYAANADITPLLGDMPVLGALFRSVRYERKETELVVLVTPRLVEAMNPEHVPLLPGEHWRYPTEAELFWNRDLGGPITTKPDAPSTQPTKGAPAKFHGSYGFTPSEAKTQHAAAE